MPNPDFNDDMNKRRGSNPGHKTPRQDKQTAMPEKTANWPDVPGKTQSANRSGGVKKLKIHPASKGL